jgi:AraC-type DNA-binding domain-containing proteins
VSFCLIIREWLIEKISAREYNYYMVRDGGEFMSDYIQLANTLTGYIEENLESDLSLKTLSQKFNYSPYFLQRLFTAAAHMSIHDYVTERRLIRAGGEILNGSRIIDAALKYGYNSHNGFIKAFERKFSLPPSRVNECVSVVLDKPLRLLERDFYNTNGQVCICHNVITMEKIELAGELLTVNLKDFWNNEKVKGSIEDKVISFIRKNRNNPTYCAGIQRYSDSEVQYFIGSTIGENEDNLHKDDKKDSLTIGKSLFADFSFTGDLDKYPDVVINDILKCFSICGIIPDQHMIDHLEIFTIDYLKTKNFRILVPLKKESKIV